MGTVLQETAQTVSGAVVGFLGGGNDDDDVGSGRYETLLFPNTNAAAATTDLEQDLGMPIFGSPPSQSQQQQSRQEPLLGSTHSNSNSNTNGPQQQPAPNNNGYVFLPPFRLRRNNNNNNTNNTNDGWAAVADLDVFFTSLYQYYYHRGYTTLALKGMVELVTLMFTLGLSIFLFAFVDWSRLASCTEESTCHATFSSYLVRHPFSSPHHSIVWKGWVLLYALIFFWYGMFAAWSWWHSLQRAQASKQFMEQQLGIGERKLQSGAVDWDRDVVAKIQTLQTTGQYRIAIHGQADETLDALLIAQRILRKENFMMALFNNPTLLDWRVPFAPGMLFFSKSLEVCAMMCLCDDVFVCHGDIVNIVFRAFSSNKLFCIISLSQSIRTNQWTMYFCILNFMFNHKYQLRPAFYLDPNSLKRRFFLSGIAHVIFMPFLLFFMTLYFSLQNAYDWKATKDYLGPREWSSAAKWTLREFNELPHLFERRMEPSYDAAEKYLKLFRQNEILTAVGRIMVFLGGSMGAVLFAFAAMNDAILLHVKIADWNLLWYAGVTAAIYSTGKAMLPSQEKEKTPMRTYHSNLSQEMDLALEQVAKHTHHFPDVWKGRGWDKTTTYAAFKEMYKYKAQLFIQELLSIIVAPYILCVSLPRCAERVCDFVLAIRAETAGAGDVCGYCTFDFDKFGDELWEGKTFGRGDNGEQLPVNVAAGGSLSESILQSGNVRESTQQFPKPKAKEGKMEKSFFSFKASHPSWKCSSSGQDLVDRLQQYQEEESAAMVRERQLHIQAAGRQLELMAQLEQERLNRSRHGNLGNLVVDSRIMNDSYISSPNNNTHTAADAGAGAGIPRAHHQAQSLAPVSEEHAASFTQTQGQQPPEALQAIGHNVGFGVPPPDQNLSECPPFAARTSDHVHHHPPGTASRQNRHSTANSASLNNLAPPPSIFPPANPGQQMSTSAAAGPGTGVQPLEGLALSSELRRILNMSTLDPDVGSVMADSTLALEDRDRAAERQYLWLERYHAHSMMASRRAQDQQLQVEQSSPMPTIQQEQQQQPCQPEHPMAASMPVESMVNHMATSPPSNLPFSSNNHSGGSSSNF